MAKIDTSLIEGYADMSAEDKLKALEAYDVPDPDYTGYVKKDLFDSTSSDVAKLKKELKQAKQDLADKMTDDEKAKLAAKQAQEEMEEKYNALLRESTISKNKAKYIGLGYDEKLAEETATALADNDMEKVFANQQKNLAAVEKRIKAEILKDTPNPEGGNPDHITTAEEFQKMGYGDQLKYIQEHPNWKTELKL